MIDLVCEQLQTWLQSAVGVSPVSFAPPGATTGARGVSCYLLELAEDPPLRGARNAPLQLACHFLVTCWAPTPLEANRLLGEVIFAAMQHADYRVLLQPAPAELWLAFATLPRPSFVLRVPVHVTRPQTLAPRVRKPIDVESAPLTQLTGVVLGPGEIPLAGARVELPAIQRVARTDAHGRFRLTSVAAEPRIKHLRISAKGETREVAVTQPVDDAPVVVHFDLPLP